MNTSSISCFSVAGFVNAASPEKILYLQGNFHTRINNTIQPVWLVILSTNETSHFWGWRAANVLKYIHTLLQSNPRTEEGIKKDIIKLFVAQIKDTIMPTKSQTYVRRILLTAIGILEQVKAPTCTQVGKQLLLFSRSTYALSLETLLISPLQMISIILFRLWTRQYTYSFTKNMLFSTELHVGIGICVLWCSAS